MNKPLLGLVFAIAVLALAISMRSPKEGGATGRATAAGDSKVGARQSPESVLAISPSVRNQRVVARPPHPSPLMEEYAGKRDRKALYDRLSGLATRTAEESYVLAEILNTCRQVVAYKGEPVDGMIAEARNRALAGISPKDPMRERRIAAFDSMYAGTAVCKGFRDVPITSERIRELMTAAARAGDPKAQARLVELDIWAPLLAKLEKEQVQVLRVDTDNLPTMSESQLATLQQLAATNDPAVLMVAARLFGSTMGDMQIHAGPDERAVDVRALYDAWLLTACDAGAECGPTNETMLGGCFAQANCDASNMRDYLFYYVNSPQQSQLVSEYQAQIQRAIQTRDWSYFTFRRGPPAVGNMAMRPPP